MKKLLALCLVLVMVFSASAMALNYYPYQGDTATFETLEEARVSSPVAVQNLETNTTRTYISLPGLDCYPANTVFVYRSANMYGGRAAARNNTNIVVFVDQAFDKDAAYAYIESLGLIDIIDEAIGSIVLVTPANGTAFGAADQANYYFLQTAMLGQKYNTNIDGQAVTYSDAEYFGGYGFYYVIGIEGGATFINNYIASQFDFVSRISALLLVGGTMDKIRDVANIVPVYMVNPAAAVQAKYEKVNGVDAVVYTANETTKYNLQFPVRKVIVAKAEKSLAEYVNDAYYGLFIKCMRMPVLVRGMYTAGTPFQGYSFDESPYSLFERNAVLNDKTADGIYRITHQEERFADLKASNGEYLQTWYEYLPEEVLFNTAPEHSIPLIVGNHGSQDDPRLFVDELGYTKLIGEERIALVAAEHQYISEIRAEAIPALTRYMLETYPALDPSRVYITGYSMGGSCTYTVIAEHPELYAAAVPMASSSGTITDEQFVKFETLDLPFMLSTSTYDNSGVFNSVEQHIPEKPVIALNNFLKANEMEGFEPDFEAYPISGFAASSLTEKVLNGEYLNHTWLFNNDDGIPMVGLTITEGLVHALYPDYANLMWNFCKHYSRDVETGAIIYNAYVD